MKGKFDFKKYSVVIIPAIVAVVVLSAFAISGRVTKNTDAKAPTAQTSVSAVNEEDSTVPENVNSKVTILAVGDNLIHNTLIEAGELDDGTRDYTSLYANMKPEIEKADIAVINQETMLTNIEPYAGYPMFNTPYEVGEAAIDAGFDVFTCASNHSMDMGFTGIQAEIDFFKEHKNVVQLGVNESADRAIKYYEKNGITFAMLNYTYGTNGIDLPADKPWCVDLMNKEVITADITQARQNADVVIVFPHWGTEYSNGIDDYQRDYTQLFLDLGVDIVIGCHPHVIEPVEWVSDDETGRKMLVYYSLGNFISHQLEADRLIGGMAQITVEKNNGNISISTAKFIPVVTHYNRGSNGKFVFDVYKLGDWTDELAASHSQDGCTVEHYKELAGEVIDEQFLSYS